MSYLKCFFKRLHHRFHKKKKNYEQHEKKTLPPHPLPHLRSRFSTPQASTFDVPATPTLQDLLRYTSANNQSRELKPLINLPATALRARFHLFRCIISTIAIRNKSGVQTSGVTWSVWPPKVGPDHRCLLPPPPGKICWEYSTRLHRSRILKYIPYIRQQKNKQKQKKGRKKIGCEIEDFRRNSLHAFAICV